MFRKLLISTAIVSVMSGVAVAQTKSTTMEQPVPAHGSIFMTMTIDEAHPMWLSSHLVGKPVYTVAGDSGEAIGEINDLVLSADGTVKAAIVGVGGFLGIGEKDVAVSFERLTFVPENNGEVRVSVDATREQLNEANPFDRNGIQWSYPQLTEMSSQQPAASQDPAYNQSGQQANNTYNTSSQAKVNTMTEADTISAEKLIGLSVYDGNEARVGEVGDVILAKSGDVDAVIVDVGGFLGMGEKPVAIGFDQLKVTRASDNDLRLMSTISKEKLEGAMEYNKNEYETHRTQMRVQAQ